MGHDEATEATAGRANVNVRNGELDGLRGWAALVVAIFHTVLYVEPTQIQRIHSASWHSLHDAYSVMSKLFFTVFNGLTAVFIFFTLSGAVLFKSLIADNEPVRTLPVRFYVRRFFRIYPALIVCLVASAIVFPILVREITLRQLAENVALARFQVNGATWTLNAEMIAPAFILLVFAGYRFAGEVGLVVAAGAISLLLKIPAVQAAFPYFEGAWLCFAFGTLVPTRIGAWVANMLPRSSWIVVLVLVVFLRSTLQHLAIAVLIALIYHRRAEALGRWLARPISHFLGRISYSFYLFNMIFVEIICARAETLQFTRAHPIEVGLACSLAVVLLSVPVAYLSWAMIEMPFNRLGRWLTVGRAQSPSTGVNEASV